MTVLWTDAERQVFVDLYDAACVALGYLTDPDGLTDGRGRIRDDLHAAVRAANPLIGPVSDGNPPPSTPVRRQS